MSPELLEKIGLAASAGAIQPSPAPPTLCLLSVADKIDRKRNEE